MNCDERTICYEVQLRSSNGGSWGLAGQNYRLYYDATLATFRNGSSNLSNAYNGYAESQHVPGADASSVGGGLAFENNVGFLNYGIDLKEEGAGGITLSNTWVPTSTLCFDINEQAMNNGECFSLVWAREARTRAYFDAYVEVSEWQGPNQTTRAVGNTYDDLSDNDGDSACFAAACTVAPVDPCAAKGGDKDGDGICALDDCDDLNAAIGSNQIPGTACNDGRANTTNDIIQSNGCTCAGTLIVVDPCAAKGGDWDGDGICALDDCDDSNAAIGANKVPGTPCNDGRANTTNDVIQSNGCTCAGTLIVVDPCAAKGGDKDGDGICALDDCDDLNASIGTNQVPGTACNDGDATTTDDKIQSDGCTCRGTEIITDPVANNPYEGTKSYGIQLIKQDLDCTNKQICYDVQIKSTSGDWILGGQNYRLFYNSAMAEYAGGSSKLSTATYDSFKLVQDVKHQAAGGSLSFGNDLGFLNYGIDLKDEHNGGIEISNNEWTTTSNICFDLTNAAINQEDVCMNIVWAREQLTGGYADAFVELSEWIGSGYTAPSIGFNYYDLTAGDEACFNASCPTASPCTAEITSTENSIIISGLNDANSLVYVLKDQSERVYFCSSSLSSKCPSTVNLDHLEPGEYTIWVNAGSISCLRQTIEIIAAPVDPCLARGGDADSDGICAFDDCDDNNPAIGAKQTIGAACNDGNPGTSNDVIQADGCSCIGTPIACFTKGGDADGDGICAFDDCDDNNPAIGAKQTVGAACNDGNPGTSNDVIQADGCSCLGTPIACYTEGGDADGDGICDNEDPCLNDPSNNCNAQPSCDIVSAIGGNGRLTISNLNAPIEIVQVFDKDWNLVFKCQANCKDSEIVEHLPEGRYYVVAGLFDASWNFICSKKNFIEVAGAIAEQPAVEQPAVEQPAEEQPADVLETTSCGEITVRYGNGTIELQGEAGRQYFFKVARITPGWINAINCTSGCGATQKAEGLPGGTYSIRVFNHGWKPVCGELRIDLDGNSLTSASSSRAVAAATETIRKEVQLAKTSLSSVSTIAEKETPAIQQTIDKSTYQIYPNPAQSELFVNLRDYAGHKASLRLLNQLGKTLFIIVLVLKLLKWIRFTSIE